MARNLLAQFTAQSGKVVRRMSRAAEAALLAYSWPGNISELENVVGGPAGSPMARFSTAVICQSNLHSRGMAVPFRPVASPPWTRVPGKVHCLAQLHGGWSRVFLTIIGLRKPGVYCPWVGRKLMNRDPGTDLSAEKGFLYDGSSISVNAPKGQLKTENSDCGRRAEHREVAD